jgi:hypothetical protein
MLPALAGATAAKVLCIMLFAKFPLGGREKIEQPDIDPRLKQ